MMNIKTVNSRCTKPAVGVTFAIIAMCVLAPTHAAKGAYHVDVTISDEVKQLIPAIKAGEAALNALSISGSYTRLQRGFEPVSSLQTASNEMFTHTLQGEKQWKATTRIAHYLDGTAYSLQSTSSSDGDTRRSLGNSGYARIEYDCLWNMRTYHPHNLMSFQQGTNTSHYLETGIYEILPAPDVTVWSTVTIDREKDQAYMGRTCVVLTRKMIEHCSSTSPPNTYITRLWICPELNYLPLKQIQSSLTNGQEEQGWCKRVDSLTEITPGVLFPKQITACYNINGSKVSTDSNCLMVWKYEHISQQLHGHGRPKTVAFPVGTNIMVSKGDELMGSTTVGPNFESLTREQVIAEAKKAPY